MDELLARIRAAVRRGVPAASDAVEVVTTDNFTVDLAAPRVLPGDKPVRLTPTEWSLLELLVRHAGKLVPQKRLLVEVWGPAYEHEPIICESISRNCNESWNPIRRTRGF